MVLAKYKSVLNIPGMRTFMLVALIARIPATATSTALTLSVVLDRHLGYGAAGLASGVYTLGLVFGLPRVGRAVDRYGPRPVLCLTALCAALFWTVAPVLPFAALLPAAFVGGALQVPIVALIRLTLADRVPDEHRRQAFSLDTMLMEVAFMVGPALTILLINRPGAGASTLRALGGALVLAAGLLYAYRPRASTRAKPPSRDGGEPAPPPHWLAPRFLLILGVTASACVVLSGTDISIIATLRAHGQTDWAGVALIAWGAASIVGGFVYGALPRPPTLPTLLLLLGAATIPVGIAHDWQALCLVLIPAGMLCAPTLAATLNAVSHAAQEGALGEAIGRHTAALTLGVATGSLLAGTMIDHFSPAFGFVAVGAVGAVLALTAMAASP